MALRARERRSSVPSPTIDRAIDYVKRSQNADGGFIYRIEGGERESAFPRSAAAVAALYSAGIYKGPEIQKGLDYVMQFIPAEGAARRESYYYYGQYYAVQAMWQAGGPRWARWYPAIRDELIGRQRNDGSWLASTGEETAGNEYATAHGAFGITGSQQLFADFSEVTKCCGKTSLTQRRKGAKVMRRCSRLCVFVFACGNPFVPVRIFRRDPERLCAHAFRRCR